MLIYEQDGNILALLSEALKGSFNVGCLCLGVYDEEVLLRVWGLRDVLRHVLATSHPFNLREPTPTPARSMPVTVS